MTQPAAASSATLLSHHGPTASVTSISTAVSADGAITPPTYDLPGANYIDHNERAGLPGRSVERESTKHLTSILNSRSGLSARSLGLPQNIRAGFGSQTSSTRERISASIRLVSSKPKEEDKDDGKSQTSGSGGQHVKEGGMIIEPEPVVETTKTTMGGGQAGMLSTLLQYYDTKRDDGLPMDSQGHRESFLPSFLPLYEDSLPVWRDLTVA